MGRRSRLSEIKPGERGSISEIEVKGRKKRRLIDLGFTEGTKVACIGESPFGSPRAYMVRGAVIALRTSDTREIYVEMEEEK